MPFPGGGKRTRNSAQSSHNELTHFRDPFVVPVDVDDAESMVQRRLGDQQIGNRCAMPHAVVMREILLKTQRTLEDVGWSGDNLEAGVKLLAEHVVSRCGARRVQLFQLADRTEEKLAGELIELPSDDGIG